MKILIVEDEKEIVRFLELELQHEGYETEARFDGRSGLEAALTGDFGLILLDIMLPDEDGLHILKRLRAGAETADLPVMMLTAKSSEYDRVVGLDSGADDYLPKPFGMMELVSRVRALLRRAAKPAAEDKLFTAGSLAVDVKRRAVTVDGEPVILTYKEFELLCYLLENRGVVLSRDQILTKIWDYNYSGETRTVDVHIRTLRQKLGDAGALIETVRGVGYRLAQD